MSHITFILISFCLLIYPILSQDISVDGILGTNSIELQFKIKNEIRNDNFIATIPLVTKVSLENISSSSTCSGFTDITSEKSVTQVLAMFLTENCSDDLYTTPLIIKIPSQTELNVRASGSIVIKVGDKEYFKSSMIQIFNLIDVKITSSTVVPQYEPENRNTVFTINLSTFQNVPISPSLDMMLFIGDTFKGRDNATCKITVGKESSVVIKVNRELFTTSGTGKGVFYPVPLPQLPLNKLTTTKVICTIPNNLKFVVKASANSQIIIAQMKKSNEYALTTDQFTSSSLVIPPNLGDPTLLTKVFLMEWNNSVSPRSLRMMIDQLFDACGKAATFIAGSSYNPQMSIYLVDIISKDFPLVINRVSKLNKGFADSLDEDPKYAFGLRFEVNEELPLESEFNHEIAMKNDTSRYLPIPISSFSDESYTPDYSYSLYSQQDEDEHDHRHMVSFVIGGKFDNSILLRQVKKELSLNPILKDVNVILASNTIVQSCIKIDAICGETCVPCIGSESCSHNNDCVSDKCIKKRCVPHENSTFFIRTSFIYLMVSLTAFLII